VRLIIADNQEVYREGVKSLLADLEWVTVVGEADDDVALLELLEQVATHVVLLDPGISDRPGLQVVERVHELAPEVRMVIVTAVQDHAHVRKAIEFGADGYLLKSASSHELVTALRMVADGHQHLQGELVNSLVDRSATSPGRPRPQLSSQHLRILQLVAEGSKNKQIASELDIGETTVKSQLRMVYSLLDVSSRVEAVVRAVRLGLVE